MRYLLAVYVTRSIFESLTEDDRQAVLRGHEELQALLGACSEQAGLAELAARIPDAMLTAIEVRPLMDEAGIEL